MFTGIRILKRLSTKSPDPRLQQQPLGQAPSLDDEQQQARQWAYLVTFSHPVAAQAATGETLVAPETLTREQILRCLQDACAHPVHMDARSVMLGSSVQLKQVSVWRELHQAGAGGAQAPAAAQIHAHYHVAVSASHKFSFAPVKRALLRRHGLASHWSCTHNGYWSCIRYVCMPSPTKSLASLDRTPVLWAAEGQHPPPRDCCHQPLTAAAVRANRTRAEDTAAEAGKREPRVSEMTLWPLVVDHKFRNTEDDRTAHMQLVSFAQKNCSPAVCEFLFKMRAKLPTLIDDIWDWENVSSSLKVARRSREEALRCAAAEGCVCNKAWSQLAEKVLTTSGIDKPALCKDILQLLRGGRCETTPVLVLAGAVGGEGKSILLKGLASLFYGAEVFGCPERGNFPMLGLEKCKMCLLDDWRFDSTVLSLATQLKWYDGSAITVTRPQNVPGVSGHFVYRGTAPIVVTTKQQDIDELTKAAPRDGEASMLLRRLRVYTFSTRIAKPAKPVPVCPRCFADLLMPFA